MTRVRSGFSGSLASAFAAAGTTWVATFAWRGFTQDSARYLVPLLVLGAVLATSGAVARWARLAMPLVVLVQVVLAVVMASMMFGGSPLPVGDAWVRMVDTFQQASDLSLIHI